VIVAAVVVVVYAATNVVAPERVSIFRFFTFLMSIFALTSQYRINP